MSFTRRSGSGRPRQTSRREDHHIVRNARVQPSASSAAIQAQVAPSLGAPVSSQTIRRRLAKGHLGNWTAAEWNQVVFSDESRFNLSSDDNRVRVWRPRGERLNSAFPLQWHTAPTAARQCLASHGKGVTRLSPHCYNPSLAFSIRDFFPTENIWDHLGRRVGHPTSLNEQEARLQQIWNEMSHNIIQNFYALIPDRIASCIRATGIIRHLRLKRLSVVTQETGVEIKEALLLTIVNRLGLLQWHGVQLISNISDWYGASEDVFGDVQDSG
ncbi:transposable element Tcb2 transposase [Trichonephila clavipes]|nr:transposable element Tcb2 transposase [Trichonephila clavipes]